MPYPDDVAARTAVIDLLGSVWPHVPGGVERARRWGADWLEVSTPFVRWIDGRAVSVVGVLAMPVRVNGRDLTFAGIHGVATHPAHRGRGLFRSAMEEALAFAESISATQVLWTEEPAIYERFGFRRVEERLTRIASLRASRAHTDARVLDTAHDDDVQLLRDALAGRTPVSERLATREPGWHFLIDLALHGEHAPTLVHVPALDTIVAIEDRARVLRIHDLVAPEIPPLDELVAHLGGAPWGLEIALTPDRLVPSGVSETRVLEASDVLMVRGPLAVDAPIAFSSLARC